LAGARIKGYESKKLTKGKTIFVKFSKIRFAGLFPKKMCDYDIEHLHRNLKLQ
jgi:hypothetical protein